MDQARSHLSPKGGQSPALFAGDWPPAGAPASGNADAEGEAGSAIACGALAGLWRGFGGLLADPVEAPRAGPGEVELAVSEAGLRSLPAQQQAPKALPYGRQFPPTWSSRPAGIARAGSCPGGDDPPVTRCGTLRHERIVTTKRGVTIRW